MTPRHLPHVLYVLLALSLVFRVEYMLTFGISQYESINLEDLIIFLLLFLVIVQIISEPGDKRKMEFNLSALTALLILTTGWIIITIFIAWIRVGEDTIPQFLWIFKWFEILILVLLAQHHMNSNPHISRSVIFWFIVGGTLLAIYSLAMYVHYNPRRVSYFFTNPNTYAYSMVFFFTITLSYSIYTPNKYEKFAGVIATGSIFICILLTGSRSGILTLFFSFLVFIVLSGLTFSPQKTISIILSSLAIPIISLLLVPSELIVRYFGWFELADRSLSIADSQSAQSFIARYQRLFLGFEYFRESPIFGYGWYASPERISTLYNQYQSHLVELGVVGLILMIIIYCLIFKELLDVRRSTAWLGNAGIAWFSGLLFYNMFSNATTTPRTLMILFLFVIAAKYFDPE